MPTIISPITQLYTPDILVSATKHSLSTGLDQCKEMNRIVNRNSHTSLSLCL